jgi:hypothetical protein
VIGISWQVRPDLYVANAAMQHDFRRAWDGPQGAALTQLATVQQLLFS